MPGLIRKYYGYDPDSGAFCGCYHFDSEESRQAFRMSELARAIPAAYQAEDLRVDPYEVLLPLMRSPSWQDKLPGAHPTEKTIRPIAEKANFAQHAATRPGAAALVHELVLRRRVYCGVGEGEEI